MTSGRVIGLARRGQTRAPMEIMDSLLLTPELGVLGDCKGQRWPRRGVTILAKEDWNAAMLDLSGTSGPPDLHWTTRRANVFVEGIALPKGEGSMIALGGALLEVTDETFPCHKMETAFPGLMEALGLDWRGGVTCRVVSGGTVSLGDYMSVIKQVTKKKVVLPG
jgi:MOSC domain-containing protein YiiM